MPIFNGVTIVLFVRVFSTWTHCTWTVVEYKAWGNVATSDTTQMAKLAHLARAVATLGLSILKEVIRERYRATLMAVRKKTLAYILRVVTELTILHMTRPKGQRKSSTVSTAQKGKVRTNWRSVSARLITKQSIEEWWWPRRREWSRKSASRLPTSPRTHTTKYTRAIRTRTCQTHTITFYVVVFCGKHDPSFTCQMFGTVHTRKLKPKYNIHRKIKASPNTSFKICYSDSCKITARLWQQHLLV